MSQAKVDRYKKEKANRKKTLARNKAKRIAGIVCAWAIVAVLAGWAGVSIYNYYEDTRPAQTFKANVTSVAEYLNSLDYSGE